jgi:hypothetical protein
MRSIILHSSFLFSCLLFSRLQLCTDPHIRDNTVAQSNISSRTPTPTAVPAPIAGVGVYVGDAVSLSAPSESQVESALASLLVSEETVSESHVAQDSSSNIDNNIISINGNTSAAASASASASEANSSNTSTTSTTRHSSMSTSITSTVPVPTTVPTTAPVTANVVQSFESYSDTLPKSSVPPSASKLFQTEESCTEKQIQGPCSAPDVDVSLSPGVMVTVSDLMDHPSKPHSLIFFLRVPVEGREGGSERASDKRWEVELEFEFDLLTDDARSIVVEMKECEELSAVRIDVEHITRVFAPFVLAANRHLALSPTQGSSSGLAKAVISEVREILLCETEYNSDRGRLWD